MIRLNHLILVFPAFFACGGGKGDTAAPPGDADTDVDADADTDSDADTDTTRPTDPIEVYINEIMASNLTVLQDETGAFPDWVEIWNGTGGAGRPKRLVPHRRPHLDRSLGFPPGFYDRGRRSPRSVLRLRAAEQARQRLT